MKLAKTKYHSPDPMWNYTAIWHDLQDARAQLEKLLTEMASIEEATKESACCRRSFADRWKKPTLSNIYRDMDRAMSRFPDQDDEDN